MEMNYLHVLEIQGHLAESSDLFLSSLYFLVRLIRAIKLPPPKRAPKSRGHVTAVTSFRHNLDSNLSIMRTTLRNMFCTVCTLITIARQSHGSHS
jgi:hypothetical protein